MREVSGDLWEYLGKGVVAITTNGYVTRDGRAVLGHGVARQAGERFPHLASELGEAIRTGENHVHPLSNGLVSFPVEDSPWSLPDLQLIGRSARELRELADRRQWPLVVVPRPGCGGGGLSWRDVKPLLAGYFDGRFHVITAGPGERT
ncbi:MAG: ADP-ribose-binding protein [Deltaproteobacteria bacterium]|nr:MAG: ADP-ribose-binding protein [Deltaproteobacteria bacterium]